jgi:hypothetical protein
MVYFVVNKLTDILDKVVPFFHKYPIIGVKPLDFYCFVQVAKLINNKAHLTAKGLEQIRKIKS